MTAATGLAILLILAAFLSIFAAYEEGVGLVIFALLFVGVFVHFAYIEDVEQDAIERYINGAVQVDTVATVIDMDTRLHWYEIKIKEVEE